MTERWHDMPFGARLGPDGTAGFRLWAPSAAAVELMLALPGGPSWRPMRRLEDGWHSCDVPGLTAGTRYAFRIDGGLQVPDPASRSNPDDVHAPSALVDPRAYRWRDAGWRGRPWHEAVIYELHLGTFTPQGTFEAATARLPDLAALGVTAIELMPVADFQGRRNWGYDGVLPFAPDASYGPPEALKALVDACHAQGLMVLLDVVYNHFGPDGNYLHAYARAFFDAGHRTPWGAAINFGGAGSRTVRDFFVHNALYWLTEYHFDGLRLDAVHAIADASPRHIIEEIAQAAQRLAAESGRHVHLVLENDANEARWLQRGAQGCTPAATAQWNDDAHHAAHVIVTGERDGYYADYAERPLWCLGRALAEGFVFQGEASPYRGGAARGEPCAGLPPLAFVGFLQTHDQVGNRALGERIAQIGRPEALRALAACLLLAPAVPMIFMGEEYAASTPFLYFCDFDGDLALAVARGRRAEFARFERFADAAARERIPDPNDVRTFERSRLDWAERANGAHALCLAHYTELLKLRRERLWPWLAAARAGTFTVQAPGRLEVTWPLAEQGRLHLLANLADVVAAAPAAADAGELIYDSHPGTAALAPWSVQLRLVHGDR